MKFLRFYKPSKEEGTPPTQEEMERMGKLIEEWTKSGVLLATEGCLPTSKGARVRLSNGKYAVTDGPFTESKEVVEDLRSSVRNRGKKQSNIRSIS
jgi:hypothetical protein